MRCDLSLSRSPRLGLFRRRGAWGPGGPGPTRRRRPIIPDLLRRAPGSGREPRFHLGFSCTAKSNIGPSYCPGQFIALPAGSRQSSCSAAGTRARNVSRGVPSGSRREAMTIGASVAKFSSPVCSAVLRPRFWAAAGGFSWGLRLAWKKQRGPHAVLDGGGGVVG